MRSLKKVVDASKKMPDAIRILRKTEYNTKITEIESKISSSTGFKYYGCS